MIYSTFTGNSPQLNLLFVLLWYRQPYHRNLQLWLVPVTQCQTSSGHIQLPITKDIWSNKHLDDLATCSLPSLHSPGKVKFSDFLFFIFWLGVLRYTHLTDHPRQPSPGCNGRIVRTAAWRHSSFIRGESIQTLFSRHVELKQKTTKSLGQRRSHSGDGAAFKCLQWNWGVGCAAGLARFPPGSGAPDDKRESAGIASENTGTAGFKTKVSELAADDFNSNPPRRFLAFCAPRRSPATVSVESL